MSSHAWYYVQWNQLKLKQPRHLILFSFDKKSRERQLEIKRGNQLVSPVSHMVKSAAIIGPGLSAQTETEEAHVDVLKKSGTCSELSAKFSFTALRQ